MSHDKNAGAHTFLCDGPKCNEFHEGFEEDSFTEVWNGAKDAGWIARPVGRGEFMHYCPACKEDRK